MASSIQQIDGFLSTDVDGGEMDDDMLLQIYSEVNSDVEIARKKHKKKHHHHSKKQQKGSHDLQSLSQENQKSTIKVKSSSDESENIKAWNAKNDKVHADDKVEENGTVSGYETNDHQMFVKYQEEKKKLAEDKKKKELDAIKKE